MPFPGARTAGITPTVLALALTTVAASAPSLWDSLEAQKRATCEDVHIFLARGWKEDYPGRQGVLVDAICVGQDSSVCGYENVIFDDSASSSYGPAVYQGATAGLSQITNYAEDCPDAQIVLSGYSEGAHVMGDVLAGGGGDFFGTTEDDVTGLASHTTSPGSHLAAVLLWGDPRHTASEPYNVQSGADDSGEYPRSGTNLNNLGVFSSIMRSYCLSGDEVCASGDEEGVHTSYFESSLGLVDDAAGWVRSMVGISAAATATATSQADSPATVGTTGASSTASSTSESSAAKSSSTESSRSTSSATSTVSSSSSNAPTTSGAGRAASTSSVSISATSTGTAASSSGTSTSASDSGSAALSRERGLVAIAAMGAAWLLA